MIDDLSFTADRGAGPRGRSASAALAAVRSAVGALVCLALAGCVAPPPLTITPTDPTTPFTPSTLPPSLTDAGRVVTVRIRTQTCDGVAVGSGFFIDPTTVVTNHHVVAGAVRVSVTTWDGTSLPVTATAASHVDDLATITVGSARPVPAATLSPGDPASGDNVHFVGYPEGDEIAAETGRLIDAIDGSTLGARGKVLRVNAPIAPGNSGGPLFDADGHVVGVMFAVQTATGDALALPVSRLRESLAAPAAFTPVSGCDS